MAFSRAVEQNTNFLGARAREIVDQEIDRARALDTKAAGLLAGVLAGLAGGVTLATKLADLQGGQGAKLLWASTLVLGMLGLLISGGLAVWAILPTPFRIAIHVDELDRWVTPSILDLDPTEVRGQLLYGSVIAVRDARVIIEAKARRVARAFYAFAVALGLTILCGASIALHSAVYPQQSDGFGPASLASRADHSHRAAGQAARRRCRCGRSRQAPVRPTKTGQESPRGLPRADPSRGGS
jgi:hypothetical protein